METMNKQKGMSPVVVLFLLCMFAFALVVVLKLVPAYLDYSTLKTSFNGFAEDPKAKEVDYPEFRSMVGKRLDINGVREFNFKESAYMNKNEEGMVVGFKYEVRKHMFINIDAVMSFEYETPVPRQ